MKVLTRVIAGMIATVHLAGCASTTLINSEPQGAKLYIDGSLVGNTPYTYSDTKIVGSTTMVTLKKEGCETVNATISRSEQFEVGPCIGGVFVLVPFLWIMGYKPVRTFEMSCNKTAQSKLEPASLVELAAAPAAISQECAFGF